MTPEEKAKELTAKMRSNGISKDRAKDCAIICVEEILATSYLIKYAKYWQQVKDILND